jgi:hypothetical protein
MPDLARHYRCHVRLPELRLGFGERPTDCAFGWKDAPRQEESLDFMVVARTKYATPMRTFWIDALCIDQDSITKRNHQVAQMGRIYASASEVIAWFGISESLARAFTACRELEALEPWTAPAAWKLWVDRRDDLIVSSTIHTGNVHGLHESYFLLGVSRC